MSYRVSVSVALLIGCGSSAQPPAKPSAEPAHAHASHDHHGSTMEVPEAPASPRGAQLGISCSAASQQQFDRGFFLLHNMMYSQARTEFEAALKADDRCAMLHWGVAMTWFWPLWPGQPTEEALRAGGDAVAKAKARSSTEREKAYIDAVAGYYDNWQQTDTPTRLKNWELGQRKLAEKYPDDVEAQAFWSLSMLATADRYDKTYAQQLKAAGILEKLLEQRPEHPGLMHYLLHAHDNPAHAQHAAQVATVYERIAPKAPHALHMPSHIHVRLGNWKDVIEWNIKSAAAAKEQPAPGGLVSRDWLHATDYMVYGYLQVGDDARAKAAASQLDPKVAYELNSGPGAYGLAATPARFAIERFDWKAAVSLKPRAIKYTWEKFPWAEAVTHAARALGAARSGDPKTANAAINELERLAPKVESPWWKERITIDRDVASAWLAFYKGDKKRALDVMNAAATRELKAGKDNVEPGHVINAAEQLGYLLMQLGRPKDALAAFEASLKDSAKRFNSLFGAGQAAEAAKQPDVAKQYYGQLVEMAVETCDRPAYKHAKSYLAANP